MGREAKMEKEMEHGSESETAEGLGLLCIFQQAHFVAV